MNTALLMLALFAAGDGVEKPIDAIVVCPKEFVPALDPLLAHRHAQGHRIAYVPNTWSPTEIRDAIRKAAKAGGLKYLLLVGDAEPAAETDPAIRARTVPTHRAPAKVNVRWGSEPELATDNWYADLDDDGIPELAVGRLPVDTPQQLSRVVAKILAYEQQLDHGQWRQKINLVAGVGGFGGLVDGVIEMSTRKFLTDGIPAGYTTHMTYGSWRSPFCPDPRLFHNVTLQRHNEGCLFWVYIGHGNVTELDQVAVPGGRFHILNTDDCAKLRGGIGSPIAITLACYTGAFDFEEDCLAEEMLKAPGGPVAVYSGSRVTMPYAMAVMGTEMLGEYFREQPPTLGEVILNAKRKMVASADETDPLKNANRLLLEGIASVMSPNREQLKDERLEHVQLFNLFGDPMLRLSYPQPVELEAPREAAPGDVIAVKGTSKLDGNAVVELVCRRDLLKTQLPPRERFDPSNAGLASLQQDYELANDRVWLSKTVPVQNGEVVTELQIPSDCRGPCHVRVFVQGEKQHAIGSANVYVRPATPENRAPAAAAATLERLNGALGR